jgi:hypothetical protein
MPWALSQLAHRFSAAAEQLGGFRRNHYLGKIYVLAKGGYVGHRSSSIIGVAGTAPRCVQATPDFRAAMAGDN